MLPGCSNSTDAIGELNLQDNWQRHALVDTGITHLERDGQGLLIGTENGLFQLKANKFISRGLKNHEIVGIVRLNNNSLLASVKASDFSSGDVTLFRSKNGKNSWEKFLNNFGGKENYTWINRGPSTANPPSDTIFVRGNRSVIRSLDGGKHWKLVLGTWDNYGGLATLLYISPYHQGHVWAGGVNSLSQAYLYKSTDYGNSKWTDVTNGLSKNIEAVAYDIMTHYQNPNLVLVGLGGAIAQANNVKKSTNGGESWQVALPETGIHTFTRSRDNPNVIYGSGRDASGKLFFVMTSDFGETWKKEIFEESPPGVTTNDMEVLTIDGQKVLFFGTDHGLYSYTFEE